MMDTLNVQASSEVPERAHPERFDPDELGGRLIDVEHRARYWWATQVASGKDVLDAASGTGYGSQMLMTAGARSVSAVDLDAEAVEMTARRLGDSAVVARADIRELPFDADSFDLVVCWEAIEHVDRGERAVAEFHRVLRPGGLALVSSPNPAVYPDGNEHHVHEYRPGELRDLLAQRFAHVATYRQHAWLASVVESGVRPDGAESGGAAPRVCQTRSTGSLDDDGQTYSLVAASDAALPDLDDLVTFGSAFEVRWWQGQQDEAMRLLARAEMREADALRRLQEANGALLSANQSLAQVPVLNHRIGEMQELLLSIERSPSWRLTAPLRWVKGRLGRK